LTAHIEYVRVLGQPEFDIRPQRRRRVNETVELIHLRSADDGEPAPAMTTTGTAAIGSPSTGAAITGSPTTGAPTTDTPTTARLRALARSERVDALEAVVVAEFKTTLLMGNDEELGLEESFFDLGFTSLLLADLKQRLERMLGCVISTNVLFNSPTVDRLLTHLTDEVLTGLFAHPALTTNH
jgi:acyl carrier protein